MGKGMKVTQNEHRRRTANYEREEGWRGLVVVEEKEKEETGFLIRPPCAPSTPSSPSPAPLALHLLHPTVFFSSVLSYLRCCVFSSFMFVAVTFLCSERRVSKHHRYLLFSSHNIRRGGGRPRRRQGLWLLYMLCIVRLRGVINCMI